MASVGTPATAVLKRANVAFVSHRYVHDSRAESYGLEAAAALGVDPARVFKTLMVEVDGELCVAVVAVESQLDLKAVAAALGGKRARMAGAATAERGTGYVVGGISPLGQRRAHRTVVDQSGGGWESVYVSGGRRGFDIELAPADLISLTGAVVAKIAR